MGCIGCFLTSLSDIKNHIQDLRIYQRSSSELWPIKLELTRAFKKRKYHEFLHITMKPFLTKTSLVAVIFISYRCQLDDY